MVGSGLFWLVGTLSAMTAWMLIGNWRHTRRRMQAQQALIAETNFRRAMENSMLTGMRALDMQGRISYVNPAFCQMTGWSEAELVGRTAPFPYWPDADREQLAARLDDELNGRTTPGGFQVRVKRKDGSLFDARLYVSPLIDPKGHQTGWMTSMTDITEPNRIREQLSASYERFTTVLEALDASVSVAPLGSEELLFANKLYRLWFGLNTGGHLQMVAQAGVPDQPRNEEQLDEVDAFVGLPTGHLTTAQSENAEIFVPELGKWLEVRSRYLNWVDGRLAQMVIATDITPRRHAEEQSAAQAERAQSASRLVTMGEMASSVAHELNQPLTAINNYCNGMVSRIRAGQMKEDDLLEALDKTARQAQRAGQIIQRIRSFVRRSEPNRTLSDVTTMVSEAVELAEIELRRRNVRLSHYVAARLPMLLVDPILIEQVLVNLLKNAAESIEHARRPTAQRSVELRVVPAPRGHAAGGGVLRAGQRPGPRARSDGAAVRGLLLHQGRRHGHRPEPLPQHRGVAPGPDARGEHLQWQRSCRVPVLLLDSGVRRYHFRSKQGRRSRCMSLIPKKGTVYVVDDDEAVRDSLQWLLEGKDYRVRCFESAESFLSRYDPREVACLIVDIRMAGMTGLELQDRLLERKSPLPVVFITGHGDVPMAVNTMKKGAMDFIQKPFKEEELVSLVERMLEHAKGAFADYQSAASRDALLSKLTSREAQVLERIVAGRLNKQIADDLGISIKTVEAHRANIMEKLNANTVADLLKIALGQQRPGARP